ncbi:stAR-related lipid transfer protein 7, mitochondrial-like [Amphiura filiformis]|uniref:stAR-related lipid transfer protein 7, mitochondrial-like n=1 Tax=Amphiura filiformis TaxID=82378 RepID=UPI003B21BBAC
MKINMTLHQTTVFMGRVLFLRPVGTLNRVNLASCSREKLGNGACNRGVHTSTHWARVIKLLFGKDMSASESLEKCFDLLRRQFNVYAAQRLRRMGQTMNLYGTLYSEMNLRALATNFAKQYLKGKRRPFYVLFGGACCVSDKDRISENELRNRCSDDLDLIAEIKRLPSLINVAPKRLSSWEVVINKEDMRVWKRPVENTYLYEFKVCGRFSDISAKSFFRVQLDLEYRKVWDKYVIELDCVDRDDDTGSEVIHWVSKFPFPLQSRDYVYTRRYQVDHKKKTMMLVSRAIDHPTRPASNKHVRVTTYFSQMVIKPHKSFDESGFDYVLTYHDDPQAMFPQCAVNWVTHKGCPDYVSKLHDAAKQLEESSSSGQICLPLGQQTSKVKQVTGDSQNYNRGQYA